MFLSIVTVVLVLLAIATIYDLRTREVPDWIALSIGAVAMVGSALHQWDLSLPWIVAGGVVGLLVGYGLFRFAGFGGGDAKLIAALGMLVGPVGLAIVLVVAGLAGGVLALAALARGQRDYAYVPAILAGFVAYVGLVTQLA